MKITQLLEGKPFMTEFGIVGYSTAYWYRRMAKISFLTRATNLRRCN